MKRFLYTLLLSLFTLPVAAKNTILIMGDSLSAGYGIELKQGWVSLLQARLQAENYDYTVVNASISGDTTSNGLSRLPNVLAQYKPIITVIGLGGNDGLRGLSTENIKNNLADIIKLTKAANSKVLLLGVRIPPNYGPIYTKEFEKAYTELARQYHVVVVPLLLQGIDTQKNYMQADGIHPNAEAQWIILNNIWPKLKPMLTK